MHSLNLAVNDEAYEHLMYFISNIKDIEIIADDFLENIELIDKDDEDYELFLKAKEGRKNGEKVYSLDEIMKEYL